MKETIRSFVAFELPGHAIQLLSDAQGLLRSYGFPIRWVNPNNIHLTIKFLGDVKPAKIDDVDRTLAESVKRCEPISLTIRGAGVFPGIKRPRVFWMSVSGDTPALTALHGVVDDHLKTLGFSKERKPFRGHLTLGRFKRAVDSGKLLQAIESCRVFQSPEFVLSRLTLFESDLRPTGPVYTAMKVYDLVS